MKIFLYTLTILTIFVFQSCDFNDTELNYNEQLVVFASITAGLPILDTVLVSRTASVNEDVITNDLWINDAVVKLINDSTNEILSFNNVPYNLVNGP